MKISDIKLEGKKDDFELFAKAIRSRKLKSLLLRGAPIIDMTAFQTVCEALPYSGIENLQLETSEFYYYQLDLSPLINVLPYLPSLKQLELQGQTHLNKSKLIRILEYTQIRQLDLRSVELNGNEAALLATKIPLTKLKVLDVRFNFLGISARNALQHAMNVKPGFTVRV